MNESSSNRSHSNPLPALSSAERMVLQVLSSGKVKPGDRQEIARLTKLTELQTDTALTLLAYKKLIPVPPRSEPGSGPLKP